MYLPSPLCRVTPSFMESEAGVLEVLLVSAEGLKSTHRFGSQRHYVTIQCGNQVLMSKITQDKGKKIWWNEKFRFPLSSAECKELTKITLRIMERDKFSEDHSVGETKVHVGDIIREGSEKDFLQMQPTPHNVVLEDGKFKGEIKLGLKFLSNVNFVKIRECRQCIAPARQPNIIYRAFLTITLPRIPWRRFFFFCTRSNNKGSKNSL